MSSEERILDSEYSIPIYALISRYLPFARAKESVGEPVFQFQEFFEDADSE
jgi:hypothetical protein